MEPNQEQTFFVRFPSVNFVVFFYKILILNICGYFEFVGFFRLQTVLEFRRRVFFFSYFCSNFEEHLFFNVIKTEANYYYKSYFVEAKI